MLHIAICDDLSKDRVKLQEDIGAYFADKAEKAEVTTFESGDEMVASADKRDFQIVFMDVYMEGISGVEASQKLRRMGKNCAIIFTTTSPDHVMAGYEVRASDYLLKPFQRDEVFTALDYAISHLPKDQCSIEVISERTHITLPIREIMYIEVYGHECRIHTEAKQTIPTNQALKSLEETVGRDFIRCHKSYLVNAAFISRPTDGAFLLKNGESVPMGSDLEAQCRETFFEWSFHRTWGNW